MPQQEGEPRSVIPLKPSSFLLATWLGSFYFHTPPCPQPLHFETLSLQMPQTVPPTPGTALQNRFENKLEKSRGSQFNIQLQ